MDHASGYIQVWNKFTFSADEIIKAKSLYERNTDNYGVRIQAYHTDNCLFTLKDSMYAIIEKEKYIHFSGASDAHHNGVTELGIQTVIQMSRTMLIHSTMRSPMVLSLMNCGPWPFTTRWGCAIEFLTRILVCQHMNSGAAPPFFLKRRFCPPAILGVLPPTF